MSVYEEALKLHKDRQGKISVKSKVAVRNKKDLSLAYSPGVAEPCKRIKEDKMAVYDYTNRGNFVAVVSTGTAVLGLGDIGPEAALPVMEGKAVLFKEFAGIDAFPLCIATRDVDEVVNFIKLLEPTFAGINLEDIAAPECFEIEQRLKEETEMAIFHDDQHGTAIVVLAGLINALKLVDKKIGDVKIVVNGAGASATAVTKLLLSEGVENIIVCDRSGALYAERTESMNLAKSELARITNRNGEKGSLAEIIKDADVFIGLSAGNVLTVEMVESMAKEPIVFALANPTPEIAPELARQAGVRIIATGRSDYPNQINNVLAFPGVFRGALDVRARDINEEMKLAAAHAIAGLVGNDLSEDYIIPEPFDPRVAPEVAAAVALAAQESGVARISLDPEIIRERTRALSAIKD
ncbi:MAG TPA: malic enzyme-like NAD(P)-binding protein [Halanaerobiales bacterium]|nr:malic enzyme-like NAD(P)-binding protein [Halanaerobiales bacterium]HPZ62407.1 malic enzyme-like NAD(P)-binding protein [Halanaerobiales bacterium]HQD03805.1 malic enzyme-like NAD(P)-binding protein [Halanaerobiales bacterium]